MGKIIRDNLALIYPFLSSALQRTSLIGRLKKSSLPIPEIVVRVVVNQMLSKKAASCIYSRMCDSATEKELEGLWQLRTQTLRKCGLSNAKCRTIKEFYQKYKNSPERYENWRNIDKSMLIKEVKEHWGMSDWTASMLGIFYFAQEDIFPESDGSLQRAIRIIHKGNNPINELDPKLAKPYRSYLALYLWRTLDEGILN